MLPISANCSRKYRAAHDSGTRPLEQIRWIVLHDEEAPTAESAAQWFANPDSRGSAHLCVDDLICYRTLNNEDVPWAAQGANETGFHIEQAGFAKWSLAIWKAHRQTLRRAAYKTAFHCHAFGIPPVFRTAPGLKLGYKGITTHAECTKAFGGSHTDPGPLWPRRLFMSYVRSYYADLSV